VRLYPAVDILGGSAVRLVKGDFEASTVYDQDPLHAARAWADAGALFLHVVDLDGARRGEPVNLAHLQRITSALEVPVQYGGGLRSAAAVAEALGAGAARVLLGTAALRDEQLLRGAIATHGPERVLVSVDVRGGRAATSGWTERSELSPQDAIERLQGRGVEHFVYTSVERDGMLAGPDLDELQRLAASVRGRLTYSGGIGTLAHLEALASIDAGSLEGVIVGKALYERRFTVAEARAALGD
jgi:phosphoribosylformimino-5-aminoimidazole carboxamide ribotide isomerase